MNLSFPINQAHASDIMQKKQLTVVVSHLVPTYGLERVVLDVAKLLHGQFDVRVVQIAGIEVPADLPSGVSVTSIGTPLRGWGRLKMLGRLRNHIPTDGTDIYILAGVWVAIPWLLGATKQQRRRSLVWEHSLLKERVRTSHKMKALSAMAALVYPRAAGVVAVSAPVANVFLDLPRKIRPARVWTVANPVNISARPIQFRAKRQGTPNQPYKLVTVGSLSKLKAQDLAIRTLIHLGPCYHLTLVGDGEERLVLESLAREIGVASQVTFRGFLSKGQVLDELLSADLLVHCSVSETFGLVFSEAANVGLPVVSTDNSVAKLMIPRLVPGTTCAANPVDLAVAVEQQISANYDSGLIAAAQRARAQELGPDAVFEKWVEIIDELTDGQPAAAQVERGKLG